MKNLVRAPKFSDLPAIVIVQSSFYFATSPIADSIRTYKLYPTRRITFKYAGQKGGIQKKTSGAQNLTASTGGKPASPKQINFLKTLVADTGHTWEKYLESKGVTHEKDLKSEVVSASIAKLKEKTPI